jgi:hypothetical protein
MTKFVSEAILGVGLAIALVAVWVETPREARAEQSPPTRRQMCERYARQQFRTAAAGEVSGTTLKYSYDTKSGFCTVEVGNKDSNSSFYSRVSTNTFDPSNTVAMPHMRMTVEPVRIVWKPAPQTLVCDKVETMKDGRKICKPADPDEYDDFGMFPMPWRPWF